MPAPADTVGFVIPALRTACRINQSGFLRRAGRTAGVVCFGLFVSVTDASARHPGFRVRVDSRVELLSIVFRLAGAPEYNGCRLPSYDADITQAFAPYRNHPAIQLARQIRDQHGVGFDAVVGFAVSVTDPPALKQRVPFGDDGAKWQPQSGREVGTAAL